MTNIIRYPLEDAYESSLAQSWDWQVWTIKVNASPSFTFPAWVTTFLVVDPWKSTMQIAEINAYNAWLKTITVSNITSLDKWASIASIAVNHSVWAKVIISDNYQFWKDILDSVNSKMNLDTDNVVTAWKTIYSSTTESQNGGQSVTTTERLALTWVTNWDVVYDSTLWTNYQYIWGSWATFATWSVVNASETVAWKVELSTNAEQWTWTSTWWSGARLVVPNDQLVKTSSWASDENKIPVLNSDWKMNFEADININWLTEKTTPVNADELIIYDNVWWVNKKVWFDNLKTSISLGMPSWIISWWATTYTAAEQTTLATLTIPMWTSDFKTVELWILARVQNWWTPNYTYVNVYWGFEVWTSAWVVKFSQDMRASWLRAGTGEFTIASLTTFARQRLSITSITSGSDSRWFATITGVYRSWTNLIITATLDQWTEVDNNKLLETTSITIIQ